MDTDFMDCSGGYSGSFAFSIFSKPSVSVKHYQSLFAGLKAGESTCADVERIFNDNGIDYSTSSRSFRDDANMLYIKLFRDIRAYDPAGLMFGKGMIIRIYMNDCIYIDNEIKYFYK